MTPSQELLDAAKSYEKTITDLTYDTILVPGAFIAGYKYAISCLNKKIDYEEEIRIANSYINEKVSLEELQKRYFEKKKNEK